MTALDHRGGRPTRLQGFPKTMNPDAPTLWRGPRWTLALLLACLGMLGPFSIDTYIPAFAGIAHSLEATPLQMQQTLSAYLFGFALLNLFHGALSDSLGRRPVILWGIGRLSKNFLLRGVCTWYVELIRNIPVLIQLLMWYFVLTTVLPPVAEALHLGPGMYVSKSGMSFPIPEWGFGQALAAAGMAMGLVVSWLYRRWARAQFERTGIPRPTFLPSLAIV